MRQITHEIAKVFRDGRARKIKNTQTDGQAVWLHGNKIVWRDADNPRLYYYTLAGWGTVTTRERLNHIAATLGHRVHFFQHDHVQYVNTPWYKGETDPSDVWAYIENPTAEELCRLHRGEI